MFQNISKESEQEFNEEIKVNKKEKIYIVFPLFYNDLLKLINYFLSFI